MMLKFTDNQEWRHKMEVTITQELQNCINLLNSIPAVKSVAVSEASDIIKSQIKNVDSFVFSLTNEMGNTIKYIIPKDAIIRATTHPVEDFMDIVNVITQRLQFLDENTNPDWIEPCYYNNIETTRVEVVREDIAPIAANTELQLLVNSLEDLPGLFNVNVYSLTSGNADSVFFTCDIIEHPRGGKINFVVPFSTCTNLEMHSKLIDNANELFEQAKTGNTITSQS